MLTFVPRHLGEAAALLGDRTAARAFYVQALDSARRLRFRPELALTHLRLAELQLQDDDHGALSEALEHLSLAIPELRDMNMRPWLERAQVLSDKYRTGRPPTPTRTPRIASLTRREQDIASLMAGGLTNRDIAEQLVITEGTVEVHVKHILSKLGFRSRHRSGGVVVTPARCVFRDEPRLTGWLA